jgi:hypothetical protein
MIPSEFNQDTMAQRRKLRVLHEARSEKFKVGDRVRLRPDSEPGRKAKKDKRPIAGKITKATRLQSDSFELVVKMDDGRNSRVFATSVVKEEVLTERDATLDQGLTISKRKAGGGTWIKVERLSGKTYGVFRSFKKMKKIGKRPSTQFSVPDEDRFAGPGSDPWGYYKDRESALKLAREISEMTGERVMIEDHKGRNVKFKLAFDSQMDAGAFMSKFAFSGLFGGGRMGKDLAPAGRAFTRITLKKSPFFGSEAYEQNVEVFPERMKAFMWQLADFGGAIISDRDKK